jgi:hypothetical protein
MAWIFGGKHFGQYTYEHWFDDEYKDVKTGDAEQNKTKSRDSEIEIKPENIINPDDSTAPHKPPRQP